MEATCLRSSSLLPLPFLPAGKSQCTRTGLLHRRTMPRRSSSASTGTTGLVVVAAARDNREGPSRSVVDESLIVLRKRIHEMKMVERNYEPPQEWMHWEKQCYASYDDHVCNMVGCLQSCLMNTRPSVALSALLLFAVSVPASTAMILLRFMEVANGVLSTVHHFA
ncbi:hypothetical protein D8674_034739 [Pyrus ussuriensis x Pyrus communis]|uniref:Uncharacterized protein n=1 Tax=Pyrus ussuriensis x Pyrus communis TaxID=2448454 RepID=A0A5N5GB10_9ROSA|nr:hypothetical protein D8674_034739 [Pyrus ussuriensis x Pyrus communis]